ncbi:ImmA/IrrE family metallo-endopeptidase [Rhizobium sp. WYCCWR 11279]|uniref:ImmA/IrrE family metallo-endopeptidase n=1 Tax=Rhizobium changzhiense TaxID=2692317 RepID=UPI001490E559|nr:ImmA/IrrE family metallo-endopeptidase [Rhizobium changzhiense]NNU50446.1 ImmA/IrrE family metallo-endopeptidase [Rhizobium changzhiense]
MASRKTETIAHAFWRAAGGRARFGCPVNIGKAAPRVLPVAILRLNGLDTSVVSQLLGDAGADPWASSLRRPLRGCLIADAGKAMILVDGDDPEDQQRMTIAHEVAHFLLHYLKPREDAVTAFGPDVLAVLDRTRPPTPGERFSAALRNVPIDPFRHAMDREPLHRRSVAAIEDDADDLAIELIAPWKEVKALANTTPGVLRERYGLPSDIALKIAALLQPSGTSRGVLGLFGEK